VRVMVEVLFSDMVGGWMDGCVEVANRRPLILTYVECKRGIRTKVVIRVIRYKREGERSRNNGDRWAMQSTQDQVH
jgi:hypothetical protein